MANYSLETIYFYVLIVCAGLSILFVIFGDILQIDGPIDPVLIVPWIALIALVGYVGERFTQWNGWIIFIAGLVISSVLIFLMNFYIVVPIKNAESTISISEKDMEGRKAIVLTTIPVKGMGEIKISNVSGSISRPAALYDPEQGEIRQGQEVLVIEIKERVCYVTPYKENFV